METRDQFVSMVLVKNSDLIAEWGASYTWPTGYMKIFTSVAATGNEPITGKNIVDVLRSLAFQSKAWVYPHGTMRGSKAKGTPTKQQVIFGLLPVAKDTGTITELVEFDVAGFHLNIEFWNSLRAVGTGYQVFLFLNNMCIWVRPEHTGIFHDLGQAVGGDANNSVTSGSGQLSYQSVGEIPWKEGVIFAHLDESNFKFTFGAPTLTDLIAVPCQSGNLKLTGVAATGGSYTRPIAEAAFATCVSYSMEILSGPASTGITINGSTGAVTVAAGATAGTYKIRVIAQNTTSLYGFYDAIIVLS